MNLRLKPLLLFVALPFAACDVGNQFNFTNPIIRDFDNICVQTAPKFENFGKAAKSLGYVSAPSDLLAEFRRTMESPQGEVFINETSGSKASLSIVGEESACIILPSAPSQEASAEFETLVEQFVMKNGSDMSNDAETGSVSVGDKQYAFLDNEGAGYLFVLYVFNKENQ